MKRRDLFIVTPALAGAAALGAAQNSAHTCHQQTVKTIAPAWKPLLFDEHQNRTVLAMAELIIPATDTPGARVQAAEMLEAAGATTVRVNGRPLVPGFYIHEIGTARDQYGQAHDVKNLFVTDGAAWVSSACRNPTLTMMAVTVRACDCIVEQGRKGAL